MLTAHGSGILRHLNLPMAELERAWRICSDVGGLPAAVEDYMKHGEVRAESVEMLWDIIGSDVQSPGRSDVATLKSLERVGRPLGARLAWESLAEDMDVTQPTARSYVEVMSESFMLLTVFTWATSGKGLSARKQRKVYFIDPLLARVSPDCSRQSPPESRCRQGKSRWRRSLPRSDRSARSG